MLHHCGTVRYTLGSMAKFCKIISPTGCALLCDKLHPCVDEVYNELNAGMLYGMSRAAQAYGDGTL